MFKSLLVKSCLTNLSNIKKDAIEHPFEHKQRYEFKRLFKSFLWIECNNYQHLLITQKCLKSLKKLFKLNFECFFKRSLRAKQLKTLKSAYLRFEIGDLRSFILVICHINTRT